MLTQAILHAQRATLEMDGAMDLITMSFARMMVTIAVNIPLLTKVATTVSKTLVSATKMDSNTVRGRRKVRNIDIY